MAISNQTKTYISLGIALTIFGVAWALWGGTSSVTYAPVEGIGVFAALYVIAQGAERATEWVINLLSLIPESPKKTKDDALRKVREANSTLNGNPTLAAFGSQLSEADTAGLGDSLQAALESTKDTAAEKKANEKKTDEARRDITFLASGVSIAICALAVNGLNYGLLAQVGAKGVDGGLDRLFTVLAAAGGTKALHELIGRMQKAKEASEEGTKPS